MSEQTEHPPSPRARTMWSGLVAGLGLVGLTALLLHPVLRCLDGCFVDSAELYRSMGGRLGLVDTRLNAWILAWVGHSLTTDPIELFAANCFYPARNALAGSEHLIGVAVLTLPLRLVSADPVFLHQSGVVLSFALLALTTFSLVRWLTDSRWAAFLAGTIAVVMPWRFYEFSHVQLLNAQWFPLIWLLTARLLLGEGRTRTAALLSVVVALQLLSSFYLAYFLALTLGILIILLCAREPVRLEQLYRLAAALAVPFALLGLSAIPYVLKQSTGTLEPYGTTEFPWGIEVAWSALAPKGSLVAPRRLDHAAGYYLPMIPVALAVAAFFIPAGASRAIRRRARSFGVCLWLMILAAFVLMLGNEETLAGRVVKLPAYWASEVIPGFRNLRVPVRWGIVAGLACPVLAGMGVWCLESALARIRPGAARKHVLRAARVLLAAALAANLAPPRIPVEPAWQRGDQLLAAHRALAELPYGPVLEIPWSMRPVVGELLASRSMLASTVHWRPMLGGFTAYRPHTADFLRRIAQPLPDPAALEKLIRLTGLRWIVVHSEKLPRHQARAWERARETGDLIEVYRSRGARIYEIPGWQRGGTWKEALLSAEKRSATFAGLERTPIHTSGQAGSFRAELPSIFPYHAEGSPVTSPPGLVSLEIANETDRTWPGFDIQTEGLVEVAFAFFDQRGDLVREGTEPLDADIPPRANTTAHTFITGPARSGSYRLRLRLVQRIAGELRQLAVPAAEGEVEARKVLLSARSN